MGMKNTISSLALMFLLSVPPVWCTTIAYDGKHIAADSQITQGTTKFFGNKLIQIGTDVVGCCGLCSDIEKFKSWYKDRRQPKPDLTSFSALVLLPSGRCYRYDEELDRTEVLAPYAIGTGKEAALGALKAGVCAKRAIEIAREVDLYTGGDVSYYPMNRRQK